jgi:hypothetical protein
MRRRYPLGEYGLVIVLASLFVLSWAGQAIFQVGVNDETWNEFWAATLENWQSEFLQLLTFVALTKFLILRGSEESRDTTDEMDDKLDEIIKLLKRER